MSAPEESQRVVEGDTSNGRQSEGDISEQPDEHELQIEENADGRQEVSGEQHAQAESPPLDSETEAMPEQEQEAHSESDTRPGPESLALPADVADEQAEAQQVQQGQEGAGHKQVQSESARQHARSSTPKPLSTARLSTQGSKSSIIVPDVPGPYMVNGVRGGRFAQGKPKSDVEWKILRASQVPGPGQYTMDDSKRLGGGRFSTANPKSDVDWEILRASKLPAPGQYQIKGSMPSGGKFSNAAPKSDLDWKMIRAAQVYLQLFANCNDVFSRLTDPFMYRFRAREHMLWTSTQNRLEAG